MRSALTVMVLFCGLLVALPAPQADAASGTYDDTCVLSGCLYGYAATTWSASGSTRSITRMAWRGGTKECHGSSIDEWRAYGDGIYRESSGFVYYVASFGPFLANCSPGLPYTYRTMSVSKSWNIVAQYEFFYDDHDSSSIDFYSCLGHTVKLYIAYASERAEFPSAGNCNF